MCFSGKYTQQEVYKKICGNGGFNGYLHTNDAREVGQDGRVPALANRWDAFHQIAKDAGAMAAVLHGKEMIRSSDRRHCLTTRSRPRPTAGSNHSR